MRLGFSVLIGQGRLRPLSVELSSLLTPSAISKVNSVLSPEINCICHGRV